jgi:hypothetical protein
MSVNKLSSFLVTGGFQSLFNETVVVTSSFRPYISIFGDQCLPVYLSVPFPSLDYFFLLQIPDFDVPGYCGFLVFLLHELHSKLYELVLCFLFNMYFIADTIFFAGNCFPLLFKCNPCFVNRSLSHVSQIYVGHIFE